MEEFQIKETQFLESKCRDVILQDDENINEFLEEDEDSILIILKRGDTYLIDCYKGEYLYEILDDPTKGRYPCLKTNKNTGVDLPDDLLNVIGFADEDHLYYRIDLSFGGFYISEEDILNMIGSGKRIYYLEPTGIKLERTTSKHVYDSQVFGLGGNVISADHCQQGTEISVYKIKICGGEECLPEVFREIRFLLTDVEWKVNQNPYTSLTEDQLEQQINLGEGMVTIGLPVSSEFKELETIEIDGETTLENLFIEIFNFYNEINISEEDVADYEETPELDETLAELDDGNVVFRRNLLGRRINFKGLKKNEDLWIVDLKK